MSMRPEHALLCQLLRVDVPASILADTVAAQSPLDWTAVLETADEHGVTERLLRPLSSIQRHVPAHVLRLLHDRAIDVAAINLRHTRQLARLLDHLNANRICALAFKGPVMASGIHGHLALRACADLDLLVDRHAALRVRPLLMAQGYTLPPRRRRRAGALLYGLYPGAGRDDTLVPPRPDFAVVDVHVAFAYWTHGVRLDTRALFARAVSVDIAGVRVATLCPEDLLLVLSIHGMMHGWSFLRHIGDIDAVTGHVTDWHAVVSRARSARIRRVLHVALLLAHDLLGSRMPAHVLAAAAADAHAVAIARTVPSRLFDPPAVWDPHPWFLAFQDNARGRLRFQARTLIYEWFLKWPWDQWLGRRRLPQEPGSPPRVVPRGGVEGSL